MLATDFTRHDCLVSKRRRTYDELTREWRCGFCGARLVERWHEKSETYPKSWGVECGACETDGHDFIHEYEAARQKPQARRFRQVSQSAIDEYMREKEKHGNQGTD
jgi:hypothetical protein